MEISVIVRSFNEQRHIGRLFDGIKQQQLRKEWTVEVILVDSGSTDATVSIARDKGAKVLSIAKEEFSFGRSLNRGCEAAQGEILVFASAHVYPVYTDWLENLIRPFNEKEVALVYGKQIGNELTKFSEKQVFKKWFPEDSNYNQQTPFCNNANCAIRRSLWLNQPYDEYITGLEDLDWAHRIMNKGFKIVYEAGAPIVHVHEETPQKIKSRYQREAIALKHILPKVYFSFWDFLRLFAGNTAFDSIYAVKEGRFFKEAKNIFIFRFMQFYGTFLGHKQKGAINKDLKNRFYYPNNLSRIQTKKEESEQEDKRINYADAN